MEMKEILLVGAGSFVGGSLRYVVSKLIQQSLSGFTQWMPLTSALPRNCLL